MTARSSGKRRTPKANLMMFMMLICTVVEEPVDSHGHMVPHALACVLNKEYITVLMTIPKFKA